MAFFLGRPWPLSDMPFLSHSVSRIPDGFAVEDGEGSWSYQELAREAEGVARRLVGLGVGGGDVVALAGRLDRQLLAALHGIWKAGASVAPLSERWTAREKDGALEIMRPGLLLVGEGSGADSTLQTFPPGLDSFRLGPRLDPALRNLSDVELSSRPLPGLAGEEEAVRLLTSGTSGRSRVVRLTLGNLLASAQGAMERLDLGQTDRWFGSLSVAHVGGVALVTRAALLGSGLVLRGSFNVAGFLALVEEGSISHASLVPTMLHQVLEKWEGRSVPGSLRCLLIGGAPAQKGLVEVALAAGFPVALTYGLTEASSQVATAPPELVRKKPGTVGLPLPGVRVKLGEGGELLVQGPTVGPGQATATGWLHTGDLAREDSHGHLWVMGRLSDRIISGGVNVDPVAVEKALQSHPDVEEVAVVGVPDQKWGERVVAAVVSTAPRRRLMEELDDLARATLSRANRPRSIQSLETLPRNANGKVDREKVRALFE